MKRKNYIRKKQIELNELLKFPHKYSYSVLCIDKNSVSSVLSPFYAKLKGQILYVIVAYFQRRISTASEWKVPMKKRQWSAMPILQVRLCIVHRSICHFQLDIARNFSEKPYFKLTLFIVYVINSLKFRRSSW